MRGIREDYWNRSARHRIGLINAEIVEGPAGSKKVAEGDVLKRSGRWARRENDALRTLIDNMSM